MGCEMSLDLNFKEKKLRAMKGLIARSFYGSKHRAADFGPPPQGVATSKLYIFYGQPLLMISVPSFMPVMTLISISF
jgi:hypothetical protein